MPNSDQSLDHLRHSAAHLLAAAILELYPQAKPTLGPTIADGFYYDFDFGSTKISKADLPKIEKKMHQLVKSWDKFEKQVWPKEKALQFYSNNPYKTELIKEIVAKGKPLTFYQSGNFTDLCRGGHINNPAQNLKHFRLLSVAGAYWRGNENNPMLTRIYGTAFFTKKELDEYLQKLTEAKKRDHKILGPKLDLFTFSPLVGAGLPLWTPKGTLVRELLDNYIWELRKQKGYQKVDIPHLTKKDLYQTSGHWDKFKDELFRITTREGHQFALKPMNCPHHTQIYARKIHSYRELPQRYANTTMVYRDEQSGQLQGLSRVRCITQDDSHIFCRKTQVKSEINAIWDIVDQFYGTFDFKLTPRLSLSDPDHPEKYLGNPKDWQKAEAELRQLAQERGVKPKEEIGEAAFYGPKLDFIAQDSLGREWQVATIQLDMNMPHRFGLHCINEKGQQEEIVMIHSAIMGSLERFISVLIEHLNGEFPLWLAPTQLILLPISQKQLAHTQKLAQQLQKQSFRVEIDESNKTLAKKIALAREQKPPYLAIIGQKEVQTQTITLKNRRGQQETLSFKELTQKFQQETTAKTL